jgi:hypothetical protein
MDFKKVAFLLSALIFTVSCGRGKPSKIAGQEYKSLKYKFSITFPSGWKVDESGMMGSIVIFVEPVLNKNFAPNINIFSEETKMPAEEYVKSAQKNGERIFSEYKVIGSKEAQIGGIKSPVLDFSYRQGNIGVLRMKAAHVAAGGRMFVITCSALAEDFANYESIFEQTISAFRVY